MQDELTLLARAQTFDAQALAEIHDIYYMPIFRYVLFRVNNQELAEDLTSEVFIRLLSALHERNAPQNTLRGWLFKVASFIVNDYYRQQHRHPQVELDESIPTSISDPSECVTVKLEHENLRQLVTKLTAEQQNVLAFRFGYGMSIREVAQAVGKSEAAVKQLQARAIASLSRKLRLSKKS
ncbi:MAG: sigma-70 family RNA polymerase sigma factor [Gammaproteobacteria bacterium]|nr:sigma-70 family RNA polymerase sigma factor [Gammaproteobacteria bacterium]